jgi:hypothetical protein
MRMRMNVDQAYFVLARLEFDTLVSGFDAVVMLVSHVW